MRAGRRFLTAITSVLLVAAILYLQRFREEGEGISVTFLGGAGEVGGSCTLVTSGEFSFLVDCGAFGSAGDGILPDDPGRVSFMILTHAHADHCGRIPELFAAGFDGKIYCTPETADLTPIMLRMSRSFARSRIGRGDFDRAISSFSPVPFGERREVGPVSFVFRRAQHLLGAAFIEMEIDTGDGITGVIFSGDLGSGGAILLPSAERPAGADYVILESTYGGRVREAGGNDLRERYVDFASAVASTLLSGGDVLIPAFTLGRTQEVIAAIDLFSGNGTIPAGTEVYIDSPTAQKVSEVYRNYPQSLSAASRSIYGDQILKKPYHREVRSRTSMKVHERTHRPAIFISSSGDLMHANSPRHLARMAENEKNMLCIVGWQSYGSAGRKLVEGDSTIFLRYREGGQTREVWLCPALEVREFDAFSGHADQSGLVRWAGSIKGLHAAYLVHGETDQSEALAERLRSDIGIEAKVPRAGETVFLPVR
jgi:metallo-beta-lactamase family protein